MTDNEPSDLEPLGQEIRTHHPGIGDEIEGAIHTLRKLQKITGTVAPGSSGDGISGPAVGETTVATIVPPPEAAEVKFAAGKAKEAARREPTLLAACETFGRYQIVRLLGRGAMGAVYLAYDSQLHRHVALKTPVLGDNQQIVARFFREARAAAQLRSPYICPIYDVGQISGIYYLSMAFIDGQPLERLIDNGQIRDTRTIVELTKKIARGLQKAHEQGIIHRDLKPENIMVDSDGEPIVMDFGLAKRLDDDIQITTPGRILGTPAYMSPEQVDGNPKEIGPATDIYSLGVVLYKMLTGRTPFQGSLTSVLRQIGNAEPPRPSKVAPGLNPDSPLERICLKMMAKSPRDRFPSIADLVAALDALTPGEAAPSAPLSRFARLRSMVGRFFARRPGDKKSPVALADKVPNEFSAGSPPEAPISPKDGQQASAETTDLSMDGKKQAPEPEVSSTGSDTAIGELSNE
jgi:serine/threonine protein kinase